MLSDTFHRLPNRCALRMWARITCLRVAQGERVRAERVCAPCAKAVASCRAPSRCTISAKFGADLADSGRGLTKQGRHRPVLGRRWWHLAHFDNIDEALTRLLSNLACPGVALSCPATCARTTTVPPAPHSHLGPRWYRFCSETLAQRPSGSDGINAGGAVVAGAAAGAPGVGAVDGAHQVRAEAARPDPHLEDAEHVHRPLQRRRRGVPGVERAVRMLSSVRLLKPLRPG